MQQQQIKEANTLDVRPRNLCGSFVKGLRRGQPGHRTALNTVHQVPWLRGSAFYSGLAIDECSGCSRINWSDFPF